MGIIDYNENGPVPWETEQTSIEDIVYGHCENYHTNDFIAIDLTDDQIDDLMENPLQPEDDVKWWRNCIFQIDLEQEKEFLELAKNPDIDVELCISKKRGLYFVCCIDCAEMRDEKYVILETSTLKRMIEHGMIKQIFNAKNFFVNDQWKDDKLCFEKDFSSAPYYIYGQPYWNEFLLERLNIPNNPIKLSQFPPALRDRVPRLPIKFSESKQFQIAEWIPCTLYGEEEISINGYVYQPIVLTNGTKAYVYTSQVRIKFIDYCSERMKYNCKECSNACYTVHGNEFSDKPTVVFVFHPFSHCEYEMTVKSDLIVRHSVRIPLLHKIPYKHPKDFWMSETDVMKQVTDEMLSNFFMKNYKHFEDTVLRINPQVIILEQKTKDILSQRYLIDDRYINIGNQQFIYYLSSKMEENREDITKLALLPYRGIEMPYIISVEEMEQYKKKYNVSD